MAQDRKGPLRHLLMWLRKHSKNSLCKLSKIDGGWFFNKNSCSFSMGDSRTLIYSTEPTFVTNISINIKIWTITPIQFSSFCWSVLKKNFVLRIYSTLLFLLWFAFHTSKLSLTLPFVSTKTWRESLSICFPVLMLILVSFTYYICSKLQAYNDLILEAWHIFLLLVKLKKNCNKIAFKNSFHLLSCP